MTYSKYPTELDDSITLPPSLDLITPVRAEVVNRLRDAVLAIQGELGVNPSGVFGDVQSKFTSIDSQFNAILNSSASWSLNGDTLYPTDVTNSISIGSDSLIDAAILSVTGDVRISEGLTVGSVEQANQIKLGPLYVDSANTGRGVIYSTWNFQNVIPQSGADDLVASWGINYDSNGGRLNTSEPAIAAQFELNYDVNSDGEDADNVIEAHFGEYRPANGNSSYNRRWLSCQINLTTHAIYGGAAGKFDISDSARTTPAFTVNDGGTTDIINQLRLFGGSASQDIGSTGDIRSHANFALVCRDDELNNYPTLTQDDDTCTLGDVTGSGRSGVQCGTSTILGNIAGSTYLTLGAGYLGLGTGALPSSGTVRSSAGFSVYTRVGGADVLSIDANSGNIQIGQDDATYGAFTITPTLAYLNLKTKARMYWNANGGIAYGGSAPSKRIEWDSNGVAFDGATPVSGQITTPGNIVLGTAEAATSIKLASIDGVNTQWHALTGTVQASNDNIVTILGFNVDNTGARIDTSRHAWWAQLEYEYLTGGQRISEAHFCEYRSSDGLTNRRPISTTINITSHVPNIYFSGDTYILDATNTNQLIKMYDGGTGNVGFLEQKGAGGWISVANGSYFALVSTTTTHATLYHSSDVVVLRASKASEGLEIRSVDDTAKIALNNTGLAFFANTPVAQQTLGYSITNDITSGGSQGTFADFSTTDAGDTSAELATIRNNQFRMAETLQALVLGLRQGKLGLFT